jgi:Ca2+-binding EF-hand superfamily protein
MLNLENIDKVFDLFDKNGDNEIDKQELAILFKEKNESFSKSGISRQ